MLEPYYDSYVAMLQMAGGPASGDVALARLPLDLDELRAAVTPRTRFVLLNSPHNPTGTVLTPDELGAVAALAIEHDLVVVTDEVYEHLVFDGGARADLHAAGHGRAHADPVQRRQVVLVHRVEGRLGDRTGRAGGALVAAKQWLTYTSGAPLQPAVAIALAEHPHVPAALAVDLQERRDLLVAGLRDARLPTSTPQGTYFATSDISSLGWDDGLSFCLALPERAGVVAIPVQGFYDDPQGAGRHLVRWAFCKRREVISDALERLAAANLQA